MSFLSRVVFTDQISLRPCDWFGQWSMSTRNQRGFERANKKVAETRERAKRLEPAQCLGPMLELRRCDCGLSLNASFDERETMRSDGMRRKRREYVEQKWSNTETERRPSTLILLWVIWNVKIKFFNLQPSRANLSIWSDRRRTRHKLMLGSETESILLVDMPSILAIPSPKSKAA